MSDTNNYINEKYAAEVVKVLIAFFSYSGNTRKIAQQIHKQIGSDIFEIKAKNDYPVSYSDVLARAKKEIRSGDKPSLRYKLSSIDQYETIFLGYPNWWNTFPAPVATFLSEYDFNGKTIIPFCTHGGGGIGRSITDIIRENPGAKVTDSFSMNGYSVKDTNNEVSEWINDIMNKIKKMNMKKIAILTIVSFMLIGQACTPGQEKESKVETIKTKDMKKKEQEEHYTFALSDKVKREKVTFKNRYGITLTGDLYLPKGSGSEKLAALAISGPYGAVKEQSSGLYANNMAERGFAVLAFDPSYTGESGGEPRNVASPEIYTEDLSAAIDFLGVQDFVNREQLGIIGICGFGGFALNATAVDKRVKAVAVASMYDMSRVSAKGYFDSMTPEQRTQMLEQLSEQRWKDAENGKPAYGTEGLPEPEQLTGDEPEFVKGYVNYYKTERGFHPRSINSNGSWTVTTPISLMNMPILTYINEISPRPVLIIAGENAHSRYFSEDAYKEANEPKELMIIPGAVHTDLYDKTDIIPFDKLETFFNENLK